MTRLLEREQLILEDIVRTYIREASPVSSHRIANAGSVSSSSATIRNIMMDLEEQGFLFQPHTSSGRVPTQKAYRFFVDNCIAGDIKIKGSLAQIAEENASWNARMRLITKKAHVFTAVLQKEEIAHFGIAELFFEPEFKHDIDLLRSFGFFMDSLPDILEEYYTATHDDGTPRVFIEQENLVPEVRRMSIVSSLLDEGRGVAIAVGPSRMNYEIVITLLRSL